MKRSWSLFIVLVLLALALAACGGGAPAPAAKSATAAPAAQPGTQPGTQPAAQPAAAQPTKAPDKAAATTAPASPTAPAKAATTAPATAAPAKAATAAPAAQADDSLSLSSRDAGLDKLKSYRMVWQAKWSSTESGKTENSSWDWTEEYSSNPEAVHWIWKVDSTTEKNKGSMELFQIGKTSYMVGDDPSSKNNCISFSSDDQSNQVNKGIFSPNSLGSVNNAKFVGNETLNGVKVKHYKYDEKSASLSGYGKVNGELWVAVDGGYVVKDTMSWEGAAGLFGVGTSGKGSGQWTWELSNINQPIAIKAPENCGGASNNLPVMADATEKSSFGDMLTYKTKAKLKDVVDFYNKQMPAAGWKAGSGEGLTTDELATLEFVKDKQKAQIMITVDKDITDVMISVSED